MSGLPHVLPFSSVMPSDATIRRALITAATLRCLSVNDYDVPIVQVALAMRVSQRSLCHQIEQGSLAAVRRRVANFRWCIPLRECYRLIAERADTTAEHLLAMLDDVQP